MTQDTPSATEKEEIIIFLREKKNQQHNESIFKELHRNTRKYTRLKKKHNKSTQKRKYSVA